MNDKELIELAAKAAGVECVVIEFGTLGVFKGCKSDEDFTVIFNPLHNDGDALRLAVNIGIEIGAIGSPNQVNVEARFDNIKIVQKINGDPYAATRRAIVRAAAEIGRNM